MPEGKAVGGGMFGRIAVKQRFVTEIRLNECLEEQKKLAEGGQSKRIGDLLVQKGYLTDDQRQAIVDMQKKESGPKVYGGFELIEKIAEGGMGAVYRAKQVSLDRIVALKLLPERFAKDETFVARFYREAKVAASLDHPHIVRALDVGQAEGKHYFAMEFVEGKSLGDTLDDEGMLPEPKAVDYMLQIAQALEHAWEHQLIHRDVKPDNILIAKGDVAKLADLGLARSTIDESTRVTQTGTAMGTPHYISPEQARGEADIDIRTDIYSLGATLFHLVTGSPPYIGTTAAVIITKHLTEEPPSARERNPQVSEQLDAVIRKMMAKNREGRYANPTDLVRDLEALSKGGGESLGMTLMDASQLDFARAASLKEAEAVRRAPTQPTIVQAGPAAWIWGAVLGGAAVITAGAIVAVMFLSGASKERLQAARAELTRIDSLMNQAEWGEAVERSAAALKDFEDVDEYLPAFEKRFKEAQQKYKSSHELLAKAENERTEIENLMRSGSWEAAHKRARDAEKSFAKLKEMRAVFTSLAERASVEAEKERKRQARIAQAEKAREEVQALAAAGKLTEAIERAKRLKEQYADLAVARKLDALHHKLTGLLQQKYETVFEKGTKAFAEGRYEQAILHMQEALKLKPDSPAAKSWLRNAENQLELGKARDHVRDGDAILARKDYAGAAAKYEEAMAAFDRLAASGAGPDAARGKVEAMRKRDDVVALRKCVSLLQRGRLLENSKDWEGALKAYVAASDCARGDLVEEVARRKRRAGEEIAFEKAIRTAKANAVASRWKEVIEACQRALATKPNSTEAKALLSKARGEIKKEDARRELERVSGLIKSREYAQAVTAGERGAARYEETPYRSEFTRLAQKARELQAKAKPVPEPDKPVVRKEPPAGTSVMGAAGVEFVYVPSGMFALGSDSGDADERPAQRIAVDGFYIGKFEITNAQYERYDSSHARLRRKTKWSRGDNDPVVHVTWYDASRFCRWLMVSDPEGALHRLPTEAEWEYAARGADARSYPWGNSPKPSDRSVGCNYKDNGRVDRHKFCSPVGSFPSGASPFGCMDMAGNVWEWCLSWYSPDYYSIPRRNPVGPGQGSLKVVRGGSWNNPLPTCRASNRAPLKPTIRNANTGFRVVRIERE